MCFSQIQIRFKNPTAFLSLVLELWLIYEYHVTVVSLLRTLELILTQPLLTEAAWAQNGRLVCEAEGITAPCITVRKEGLLG